MSAERSRIARRFRMAGRVQAVGFRPFVFRLARELGLTGSVQNLRGEVEIRVEGMRQAVERFGRDVVARAPPLARPRIAHVSRAALDSSQDFVILSSAPAREARVSVPPDAFTCDDCLAELGDPESRRFRYPFINCTQCGPRYTLIEALPYDRPNTTMAGFELCPACRREYEHPEDRRFHAEPVACAACGPTLWLEAGIAPREPAALCAGGEAALARAVEVLRGGGIVAVRGIGGYHLLCDATSAEAVARLRARKGRPGKPLAVMFPQTGPDGLECVRRDVELTGAQALQLCSAARPIVLARRLPASRLSALIAPGLAEVGVLLPYSPLHHLLLADAGRPLVATSGNLSGEPVMTDVGAARVALGPLADASLHHDRPIARPADDSVVRCIAGEPRAIRLGRGLAPLELDLPWRIGRPVLATGGHLKTTVALAWEDRLVISPHIGDMGTARSLEIFAQVVEDLQRLYAIRAADVVCDAHPDYATTQWAYASGLSVTTVLHHHAHASALCAEHAPGTPMLVFAWDGAGLGDDGTLWGGETLLGVPGGWRRVASLRPFALPGGELAARAPWRCAAALCWSVGLEPPGQPVDARVRAAWRCGLNAPVTSSVGRLFDAAAALVLGQRQMSYEGEGPMKLEAAASRARRDSRLCGPAMPLRIDCNGLPRLDWAPLIPMLVDAGLSVEDRAAAFHDCLCASIVAVAESQRRAAGVERVGLAGGVFQNSYLTEQASERLSAAGFEVCLARRIPCNDGGLSCGQIIEMAGGASRARRRRGTDGAVRA